MILAISDRSCISEARRLARNLARDNGFGEEGSERCAIVASELASNIVKHAGTGSLALQTYADAAGDGVEIVGFDSGPGISDLPQAMRDGHSTAGSCGTGLGAVDRLAKVHIYSRPGSGTAAMARLPREGTAPASRRCLFSGIADPVAGETACGDAFTVAATGTSAAVLLADGLGHGALAAKASQAAVDAFYTGGCGSAQERVAAIHAALRPTRGAAVAVAVLDADAGRVEFSGIGNIGGVLVEGGRTKRMLTDHGTAGHIAGRVRAFSYPFETPPLVILHSDGLKSGWDLDAYPGLSEAHPALVAAVLFRDFRRTRDDACVVAMRWR